MPRINLLPWRDELRTNRRNQFFIGLGAAVGAAGLVILASNLVMNGVSQQPAGAQQAAGRRDHSCSTGVSPRFSILKPRKNGLLARMEIIEQLQRSRPEIVHVVEELVRTLPDGVRLTSVKQSGKRVEIRGDAESNTRVSAFMRNLDKSQWFTQPDLEIVEVREAGAKEQEGRTAGNRRVCRPIVAVCGVRQPGFHDG